MAPSPSFVPFIFLSLQVLHMPTTALVGFPLSATPVRLSTSIRTPIHFSTILQSGDGCSEPDRAGEGSKLVSILDKVPLYFPLFVVASAFCSYLKPGLLLPLSTSKYFISSSLALIMATMGLTLTAEDFRGVCKNWKLIFLGLSMQFGLMPLSAFCSGKIFRLPPTQFLGVALVGCCPGGTASNLVTLIAGGDVALSVTLTACSTMAATILTPSLASLLVQGTKISISGATLAMTTAKVVLAPVLGGMVMNKYFPSVSKEVGRFAPSLSVILVALICGSVVSSSATLLNSPAVLMPIMLAVSVLHSLGFLLGFLLPRYIFGAPTKAAQTIAVETGMQNSALAILLARGLGCGAEGQIAGVLSATFHSVFGAAFASCCRVLNDKRRSK